MDSATHSGSTVKRAELVGLNTPEGAMEIDRKDLKRGSAAMLAVSAFPWLVLELMEKRMLPNKGEGKWGLQKRF
jgi:hypothetical protein